MMVLGYNLADWLFLLALTIAVGFLIHGHLGGHVHLWDVITTTDQEGRQRTDARKLFEAGAWVVMTIGFAHLMVQEMMTEVYCAVYVASWVGARALRDREQRLNRAIDSALRVKPRAVKRKPKGAKP